jgi:hypothetical protein
MSTSPQEPLRDEEINTVGGDADAPLAAPGTDADGTDADGTDGDATDVTDGDATDADGTDA